MFVYLQLCSSVAQLPSFTIIKLKYAHSKTPFGGDKRASVRLSPARSELHAWRLKLTCTANLSISVYQI